MTTVGGRAGGRGAGARPFGLRSRAELLLVATLLALSAVAWWTTSRLATPDMRLGILTGAARGSAESMGETASRSMGETMSMAQAMSMGLGLFVTTWVVMMTAMMLPSVTPVVVGVSRIAGARGAKGRTAYGMIAGYLLVWGVIGLAAYGLFTGFQTVVSAGDVVAARVGGVVLVTAGAFQLSPLKRVCLRHCRSPLAVLAHYGEAVVRGRTGPVRVGVRHGFYCVGCCWALMAVLLAAGMMSLAWMAGIAGIVFAEKVHRRGEILSRALGVLLVVLGIVVVAVPGALPA